MARRARLRTRAGVPVDRLSTTIESAPPEPDGDPISVAETYALEHREPSAGDVDALAGTIGVPGAPEHPLGASTAAPEAFTGPAYGFVPPPAAEGVEPVEDVPPLEGYAVASFTLGLCSWFAGAILGIPAIIVGVISLHRLKTCRRAGRGFAVTGLVFGVLTTLATLAVTVGLLAWWGQNRVEERHTTAAAEVSASTFANLLLNQAGTGTNFPITLADAQRVATEGGTPGALTSWAKRPGKNYACFTVTTSDGATRSVTVIGDEYSLGQGLGTYRVLPEGTPCPLTLE